MSISWLLCSPREIYSYYNTIYTAKIYTYIYIYTSYIFNNFRYIYIYIDIFYTCICYSFHPYSIYIRLSAINPFPNRHTSPGPEWIHPRLETLAASNGSSNGLLVEPLPFRVWSSKNCIFLMKPLKPPNMTWLDLKKRDRADKYRSTSAVRAWIGTAWDQAPETPTVITPESSCFVGGDWKHVFLEMQTWRCKSVFLHNSIPILNIKKTCFEHNCLGPLLEALSPHLATFLRHVTGIKGEEFFLKSGMTAKTQLEKHERNVLSSTRQTLPLGIHGISLTFRKSELQAAGVFGTPLVQVDVEDASQFQGREPLFIAICRRSSSPWLKSLLQVAFYAIKIFETYANGCESYVYKCGFRTCSLQIQPQPTHLPPSMLSLAAYYCCNFGNRFLLEEMRDHNTADVKTDDIIYFRYICVSFLDENSGSQFLLGIVTTARTWTQVSSQ